ncbi:Nucleoporin p58/p45 [Lobosporangium transversale]|nr:Nucleoporin p58/p45 [Lobosporangium transversale]
MSASTPVSTASTTSNLFGSTTPTTSAPNLFGPTAPTTSSSNLFGTTPASSAPNSFGTSTPAISTTGLFGSTTPVTSTPSLFGSLGATSTSAAATSATSAPASTSLFSSLSTPASTSATTTPSLFVSGPSTISGTLFGNPNSTAASNALSNAANKNTLSASALTGGTTTVVLTPDTIAGSTKYTELPSDAKNTLDQLHSFLQGQIHLSATLTARSSDSLDKISKDTEELSKRLVTLNDALKRDTMVIQALQDKIDKELKQADSAGRIIEAYANTSHANFLYAGNNSAGQYFMDQCQSFEDQLRTFRSTIEDIERHLVSFNVKHPHVSHALPEVLRNQHEGFLAVAGKVALLHEEVKDKEKAYLMFRRKFFDDDSDPFEANSKHRKTEAISHGQPLKSSGRSLEGQRSFREIAKETLRPGNASAPGEFGQKSLTRTLR